MESALAAGVDSIEHCTFMAGEEQRSEPSADLVERLAASGIGLSFSLGSLDMGAAPPFVLANLRTLMVAIADLLERGGRVCIGTDAGIAPVKPADVLDVDGDPLTDPTALLRPVGVWHRGRRVV